MQYLLMIHGDEQAHAQWSKDQLDQKMREYYAYTE